MRQALTMRLDNVYSKKSGLTDEERAAAIGAADRNLFALEMAEEGLIREAERAGIDVLRRADADPRAVLAADEVLP